eukprot:Partr_v1_DN28060_c2_g3_i4_m57299 putative CCR4-NOT transcription complex subunit
MQIPQLGLQQQHPQQHAQNPIGQNSTQQRLGHQPQIFGRSNPSNSNSGGGTFGHFASPQQQHQGFPTFGGPAFLSQPQSQHPHAASALAAPPSASSTAHTQAAQAAQGGGQVPLSFEYLLQISQQPPPVPVQQAAMVHAQLEQSRHLLSNQQSTSHYHARHAAQLAKSARSLMSSVDSSTAAPPGASGGSGFEDEVLLSMPDSTSTAPPPPPPSLKQQPLVSSVVQEHLRLSLSPLSTTGDPTASTGSTNSGNTWTMLDVGGMHIYSLSPSLFSASFQFLTCLYLNHNQLHSLPVDIARLRNLVVLDLSFNKLSVLPAEIGYLHQLKELWLFENLLESLPWHVAYLHNLQFLGLEGNPVCKLNPYYGSTHINIAANDLLRKLQYEHPVSELLHRSGPQGLVSWLRDNLPIDVILPHPIPARQWIQSETLSPAVQVERDCFTCMSFNVLADKYATQQQYWYTPSWALQWSNRKELILSEILDLDADLVCLQEVDWLQYEEFFNARLCNGLEGGVLAVDFVPSPSVVHTGKYRGLFQPKSRYRTVPKKSSNGQSTGVDGCAIFYSKKFKPVAPALIVEFTQLALSRSDFEKNDTLFERFCSKDNIAMGIILEDTHGRRVLVVNVHVHWDPMQTDVKFVQTVLLMEEIQKYVVKYGKCPLVMCGDFNSLPGGLVYEYLSKHVDDISLHPDLTACFSAATQPVSTAASTADSARVKSENSNQSSSPQPPSSSSNDKGEPQALKRWKSWKESGYGTISSALQLRHIYSGSLQSAYKQIDNIAIEGENVWSSRSGNCPIPALPFTNHTGSFTGVIDYIWFSRDDFEVKSVLGGYFRTELHRDMTEWIERESATSTTNNSNGEDGGNGGVVVHQGRKMVWNVTGVQMVGFPNPAFPSDHIPVMSEFVWKSASPTASTSTTTSNKGPAPNRKR